jgi:hypothetical protein
VNLRGARWGKSTYVDLDWSKVGQLYLYRFEFEVGQDGASGLMLIWTGARWGKSTYLCRFEVGKISLVSDVKSN